jgi:uncharacterized protein with WD repeat
MPHSTTNKYRPSRVDTRANSKRRMKTVRAAQEKVKIADIRVTRIPAKERKERMPQTTQLMSSLSKEERRLRGLKKKLKDINTLLEKQQQGVELDTYQLEKVTHLDEVLEAIQALIDKSAEV